MPHAAISVFTATVRLRASTDLAAAFGDEWRALTACEQALVRQDFIEAYRDEDLPATTYRDRIGAGNLKSYADSMAARFAHGW